MVQKSRAKVIFGDIILRLVLFGVAVYVGAYTSAPALTFAKNSLGYQVPSGFFGFTLEHLLVSWILSTTLWVGMFFGILGKKIDYIIIGTLTLFALVSFYGLSLQMYLGLIGVTLLGNALGYMLKIGRQNWFSK